MSSQIIRGNALNLPLADDSVDLVVTSPPYFGLRSYQDGGEHYEGQIGAEATPAEFVDALIEATREMVRVVKPSGSIWVNLGDKYSGAQAQNIGGVNRAGDSARTWQQTNPKNTGIPNKSLIGIPWRYAIRCIDDLGLILRAEVIWSKPNGLPESVTDRVRRSHEQWFHFTLNPRYYSAVDEVREPYDGDGRKRGKSPHTIAGHPNSGGHDGLNLNGNENPLGKLPGSVWRIDDEQSGQARRDRAGDRGCTCGGDRGGADRAGGDRRAGSGGLPEGHTLAGVVAESVWEVPTEPLRVPDHLGVDHFAAFPTEWPRRIITGWSPRGVCVECGEGRRPVSGHASWWEEYKRENGIGDYNAGNYTPGEGYDSASGKQRATTKAAIPTGPKTVITGYACACPEPTAPTTPGVVLDPFGGTGTTALVADALGRHGISVDMSADYCRLAEWRTTDPKQRAKAARKPFTPAAEQVDGQASLLELIEEGA